MNLQLEINVLRDKVSALTELVNELAMAMYGRADVGDAFRKCINDLMSKCQYAGQDHIEASESNQEACEWETSAALPLCGKPAEYVSPDGKKLCKTHGEYLIRRFGPKSATKI